MRWPRTWRRGALIGGIALCGALVVPYDAVAGDPVVGGQEAQLTTAAGGIGDLLGDAVAVSGDSAVIGAQGDDTAGGLNAGSATVFMRSGQTWTEQDTLEATNGAPFDALGWSVAVSGDTVVAGAPIADSGAGSESGAAYVFVRSGTTWTQQQELTASDSTGGGRFGMDVAIQGDTIVVGGTFEATTGLPGAAYVFTRSGAVWTQQQELFASDGIVGDKFGASVDLDGDLLLVGAPESTGPSLTSSGAAYAFVFSGGAWTEETEIGPSDGASGDGFGTSVGLQGGTGVVGAPLHDTGGQSAAGSAYAFERTAGTWTEQTELLPPFAVAGDQFGRAVDVDGDSAIVGDPFDGTTGSAFLFSRTGTTWARDQKLNGTGAALSAEVGTSVAIGPALALVGAWMDSPPAGALAGSAFAFRVENQILASDPAMDDDLGTSVAIDGDWAAVGAPGVDTTGGAGAGAVYVFERSTTAWTEVVKLTASDGAAGDLFGTAVALDGDTLLVGALTADTTGGFEAGAAYVFVRSGETWTEQQKLTASNGAGPDQFGKAVAVDGDTAAIGAFLDDTNAGADAGEAYVFVRSGTVWTQEQKLKASNAAAMDRFGISVAVSGDTAVVGADQADPSGLADAGSAYVFTRSGTVWTEQQILAASDVAAGDASGASVAVDADTAMVGAPQHDTTAGADAGEAYVFVRSGGTWTQQKRLKPSDAAATDGFGTAVSIEGDASAVGAPFHEPPSGMLNGGAVYRFQREGTAWSEVERLTAAQPLVEDDLGKSVDLSGPVAIGGAPLHIRIGFPHAGAAYAFESVGVRPAVGSFDPSSAKIGGDVTLAGVALTGATEVSFGGVAATFAVAGDAEIDATVPDAGLTGPVTVTTPFGTATSAAAFLVKPSIKRFTPTSGPVGTLVTIKGSGFTEATEVDFNGTVAVFTVVSDTKITATVPARATMGKIAVTTPGGTKKSKDAFTVT